MTTLLIDGDPLAYVGAYQSQTSVDWDDDGEASRYGQPEEAFASVVARIARMKEQFDAERVIVCLSDPSRRYFRHDIYPAYKQNRTHGQSPVDLSDVKSSLHAGHSSFETKTVKGLEADDVLGILATHPTLVKGDKIVVGIDKDLMQIPGVHYNFNRDSRVTIPPDAATWFFFTQVLTGDTTDGFPGCPGIGPKKAARLFNPIATGTRLIPDYWSVVVGAYARKGLSEEHALTQARVAKICLASDYDFTNKKVIPWTPTISSQKTADRD